MAISERLKDILNPSVFNNSQILITLKGNSFDQEGKPVVLNTRIKVKFKEQYEPLEDTVLKIKDQLLKSNIDLSIPYKRNRIEIKI